MAETNTEMNTEGTYEDECMRAELLGLDKPDKTEFDIRKERARQENQLEELENEKLNLIDSQGEKITENYGKLDDLNKILSVTQQRLNSFKQKCGSLTNLLKIRPSTPSSDTSSDSSNGVQAQCSKKEDINDALDTLSLIKDNQVGELRQSAVEFQTASNSQVNKLDSMLNKAQTAQMRMEDQNRRMKKLLKE